MVSIALKNHAKIFIGLLMLSALSHACKEKNTIEKPIETPLVEEAPKINCDTFEIFADLKGSFLNLSLKTDLPAETQIIVAIDRFYFEKDNNKSQSVEYFSEKSTVANYQAPHSISVDHKEWFAKLSAHIEHMTMMNKGGYYDSISNRLHVRITVPSSQESPKFGPRNENLTGMEVTEDRYNDRYIQKEVTFIYPLDQKKLGSWKGEK